MTRILLALLLVLAFAPIAQAQDEVDMSSTHAFPVLHQFYASRDYHTIWVDGGRFTSRGKALPDILKSASVHGLDPANYGVAEMEQTLAAGLPKDQRGREQAELLWTYNAWQLASDLAGEPLDAVTLESVVTGDVADNMAELAPDAQLYKALQVRLMQIADQPPVEETTIFKFGPRLFKPGMKNAQIPALRAHMKALGHYDGTTIDADETVYDPALAKAVARFQHEYGLKDDGAIGPATMAVLNRTPDQERAQIIANLQRLREPHRRVREDKRIEVSIARYQLTAYGDDGQVALSMPVIVGQPRRQTISFRTDITGVRINPTWTVPTTIKKEDIIPELLADPAMMVRKHGVKIVANGQVISDPTQVDWSQMTAGELMRVGFTAPAGDGNPLGRYRVIMENPYDIYLHDTNHPNLFANTMRAASSGCVRVSDPAALTNFILKGTTGWNPQKIKETVVGGRTTDVVIENKIPIYLDYMTAWFNDARQLILGVDVYDLDKPRYDLLVKNGLTTQRNAQRILERVTEILAPELKEAQHRDAVLTQSTN